MRTTLLSFLIVGLVVTIGTGCTSSPAVEVKEEKAQSRTIPEGSSFSVRLDEAVGTAENRPEDGFSATLAAPVVVDGQSFLPAGTRVKGVVREVSSASPYRKNQAVLTVSLSGIETDAALIPIVTTSRTATSGRYRSHDLQDKSQTQIQIPAETLLTFRLRSPVVIR